MQTSSNTAQTSSLYTEMGLFDVKIDSTSNKTTTVPPPVPEHIEPTPKNNKRSFCELEDQESKEISCVDLSFDSNDVEQGVVKNNHFINRRKLVYSQQELAIIALESQSLELEFKILALRNKQKFYPQQLEMSAILCSRFRNIQKVYCLVVAYCQSGKTGVMCCFIRDFVRDVELPIPIRNIIILAAISDNTWAEQTKEDLPTSLHNQVFHRGNLKKLRNKILDKDGILKKNMIIIIDECHVASKIHQSISNFFKEHGLDNHDVLCAHDIKIVEFTATPDGILLDIGSWNESSQNRAEKLHMSPGPTYVGVRQLHQQRRLRQQKDLLCAKYDKTTSAWDIDYEIAGTHCNEMFVDIKSYDHAMYHIIRVHTKKGNGHLTAQGITQKHLELAAGRANIEVEFKYFHSTSTDSVFQSDEKMRDIDNLLRQKPAVHTFIFVKELLRCAKNIKFKKYLGIGYGRKAQKNNNSADIQGLLGRFNGYNDNGVSIVYTNLESVTNYERFVSDPSSTDWNSLTTTQKGRGKRRKTLSKGTRILRKTNSEPGSPVAVQTHAAKVFNSFDDLQRFFEKHKTSISTSNATGPSKNNRLKENGFYVARNLVRRTESSVVTVETVQKHRNMGIDEKSMYRVWPAYSDVTNANTLKWVLCWKYKNEEQKAFFQNFKF